MTTESVRVLLQPNIYHRSVTPYNSRALPVSSFTATRSSANMAKKKTGKEDLRRCGCASALLTCSVKRELVHRSSINVAR